MRVCVCEKMDKKGMCAYSHMLGYVFTFGGGTGGASGTSVITYYVNDNEDWNIDGGVSGEWYSANVTLSIGRSLGWAMTYYNAEYNVENILVMGGLSGYVDVLNTATWGMTWYVGLLADRNDFYACMDDSGRLWLFGGQTGTIEVSESLDELIANACMYVSL